MRTKTVRTTARFTVTKISRAICAFNEHSENETRNALRYHMLLSRLNVTVTFTRGTTYHISTSGVTQIDKVVCHMALDGTHSIQEIHNFLIAAMPRHVAFGAITVRST